MSRRTCAASFSLLLLGPADERPPLQLRGDPRVEQRLRCEPNAVAARACDSWPGGREERSTASPAARGGRLAPSSAGSDMNGVSKGWCSRCLKPTAEPDGWGRGADVSWAQVARATAGTNRPLPHGTRTHPPLPHGTRTHLPGHRRRAPVAEGRPHRRRARRPHLHLRRREEPRSPEISRDHPSRAEITRD